jgi:site-specific DNA-methyltransferase (adenine-specific)
VVDEDGVISVGHTRYKAVLKRGLEEVLVHVAVGLAPAQAKAYRIADNHVATLPTWDDDKLPLELAQLQELGFDLNMTGGNTPLRSRRPCRLKSVSNILAAQ